MGRFGVNKLPISVVVSMAASVDGSCSCEARLVRRCLRVGNICRGHPRRIGRRAHDASGLFGYVGDMLWITLFRGVPLELKNRVNVMAHSKNLH
jgi:hypothetical protein